MAECEAFNCPTTTSNLSDNVQLVSFPTDAMLPVWIELVKGPGSSWTPQPNSRLCTLHFDSRSFTNNKRTKALISNAIPSLNLKGPGAPPSSSISSHPHVASSKCVTSQPKRRQKASSFSQAVDKKSAKIRYAGSGEPVAKKPVKRKLKKCIPEAEDLSSFLSDYLNVEEDNHLNRTVLERSINSLIFHLDELRKENADNHTKESELKSMSYILNKVQENLSLSVNDALTMFIEIPNNVFELLEGLVKQDRKHHRALVRTFSLSIHFYSPLAYDFLRQKLSRALPHPRTIQSWYTTINKYM